MSVIVTEMTLYKCEYSFLIKSMKKVGVEEADYVRKENYLYTVGESATDGVTWNKWAGSRQVPRGRN